jgi:hypothetical protein
MEGFPEDNAGNDIGEYTGRKAREWLSDRMNTAKFKINWRVKREPGNCPFTGVCYDDDCLDALKKSIRDGDTLREAFNSLGYEVARICAAESDHEAREDAFTERAAANGWEFYENGEMV